MLKKKSMAIVMAASTVATSVAPVFASTIETVKVDEAKMIADVQEMLDTRYTDSKVSNEGTIQAGEEFKNSVYKIETAAGTRIKNISMLKEEIEKAKVAGVDLVLKVTDKGHREDENGNIVGDELTKYDSYDSTDITGFSAPSSNIFGAGKITVAAGTASTPAKINLTNGNVIELIEGDYQLDLSKPIDANGNLVDVTTTDAATIRQIVGFKLLELPGDAIIKPIPAKRVSDLKMTSNIEVNENLSDLMTEQGYTKNGAALINLIANAISTTDTQTNGVQYTTVVKDGVKYNVRKFTNTASELGNVETTKDGYELTINLEVRTGELATTAARNVTIVIKSDSQADLTKFRTAIATGNKVAVGNVTVLAGDDRFETAIAVSEKSYVEKNDAITNPATQKKAKAIVLVGKDAIVDGLAAAPLAAQKEAPILLTNKDEVPASTMAEIKRLVKKGTDIYLIGGENTISKEVEAQLIKEMNANLIRLEGEDRFETSIAIAEKLGTEINSKAYVVGGTGLADAMSVAALAAKDSNGATAGNKVTPIIVTPKDGLTKDAKNYLKTNTVIGAVEVVGGTSHVGREVLTDVNSIKNTVASTGIAVTRTAGDDRNDTNAKVIKALTADSITNVYVAKDGNEQLIDALAAAPLVGREGGVIVLATNDTIKAQDDAIKHAVDATATNKLTQVGNGVADTLVQKIAKLLGL